MLLTAIETISDNEFVNKEVIIYFSDSFVRLILSISYYHSNKRNGSFTITTLEHNNWIYGRRYCQRPIFTENSPCYDQADYENTGDRKSTLKNISFKTSIY